MTIIVHGEPGPQGSKRFVGRGIMIESSPKVKPWREAVKWAALVAMGKTELLPGKPQIEMIKGPVTCRIVFTMKRPPTAPKSRKYPANAPDIDKLTRSTFDALTQAGVWEDDGRVVDQHSIKVFPGSHPHALDVPGAVIFVERME